jgi:hypothetical protein
VVVVVLVVVVVMNYDETHCDYYCLASAAKLKGVGAFGGFVIFFCFSCYCKSQLVVS